MPDASFSPISPLACLAIASAFSACAGSAPVVTAPPAPSAPDLAPRVAPIAGLEAVTDLAVGDTHACALIADGTVACWGDGRFFQLGDLSDEGRAAPRAVADLRGVTALAAGETATCAQLGSGELVCWGARYNGMVDAVYDEVKAPATVVYPVAWPRAFAVGGRRAAYVGADGGVSIWEAPADVPIPIAGFAEVAEVAVGYEHVCARQRDGAVRCMGPNYGGECGNGGDGEAIGPVAVVGASELDEALYARSYETCGSSPAEAACATTLSGVVDLDAWGRLTCAVLDTGRVACWGVGRDEHARWLGALDFARVPILVPGLDDAVEVAVGWGHVCARKRDGGVACWGDGDHGQSETAGRVPRLGATLEPDAPSEHSRRPPREVPGLADVVQLEAGQDFTCARLATGRVVCWGAPLGPRSADAP